MNTLPPPNAPIWRFVKKAQRKGIIPVAIVKQEKRIFNIDDPNKDVIQRVIEVLQNNGPLEDDESLWIGQERDPFGQIIYLVVINGPSDQMSYGADQEQPAIAIVED